MTLLTVRVTVPSGLTAVLTNVGESTGEFTKVVLITGAGAPFNVTVMVWEGFCPVAATLKATGFGLAERPEPLLVPPTVRLTEKLVCPDAVLTVTVPE